MADRGNQERLLHVRVTASDAETLRTLLREERLDVGGRPRAAGAGNEMSIEAFVPEGRAEYLGDRDGIVVHVLKDATATGLARQAEVASGNRFAAPDKVPHGLGEKVKDEGQEG
ncbi:hypothetical protein GCM10020000_02240 [Streptomyces olivoverticillatus]